MPYRVLLLGRRTEGLTHEDCIEYLESEHVPLITDLPGLYRLTTSTPVHPEAADYDVVSQLWFATADDLKGALESETWDRVRRDAGNFLDVDETVVVAVGDGQLRHQTLPADV